MTTGQSLALDERPPGNPAAVADYGRDGDLGGGFVCNIPFLKYASFSPASWQCGQGCRG